MVVLAQQVSTEPLREGLATVGRAIPTLLAFLLVLIVGYFIAKLIQKALDTVLERVGFDRAVERGGIRKALAKSQYDASGIVSKLAFYGLMLIVLQMAFGLWGPNPVSEILDGIIDYLPKVLAAILIVVIATAIATAARELIDVALGGLSYGKTLANIAAMAIVGVGIFAALDQLEIAPTIVSGLFYGLLAILVGSAVVAFGGGGIPVARRYLDRWATKADQESDNIRSEAQGSKDRIKERAQERKEQLQPESSGAANGTAELQAQQQSGGGSPVGG